MTVRLTVTGAVLNRAGDRQPTGDREHGTGAMAPALQVTFRMVRFRGRVADSRRSDGDPQVSSPLAPSTPSAQ